MRDVVRMTTAADGLWGRSCAAPGSAEAGEEIPLELGRESYGLLLPGRGGGLVLHGAPGREPVPCAEVAVNLADTLAAVREPQHPRSARVHFLFGDSAADAYGMRPLVPGAVRGELLVTVGNGDTLRARFAVARGFAGLRGREHRSTALLVALGDVVSESVVLLVPGEAPGELVLDT